MIENNHLHQTWVGMADFMYASGVKRWWIFISRFGKITPLFSLLSFIDWHKWFRFAENRAAELVRRTAAGVLDNWSRLIQFRQESETRPPELRHANNIDRYAPWRAARGDSRAKFLLNHQLGNKADLIHLRQVSTEEGEILAKDFDCKFHEVSAADQITNVNDAFFDMLREILQAKRKSKQSFIEKIDRMLGGTGRVYNRGKSDSAAISKE